LIKFYKKNIDIAVIIITIFLIFTFIAINFISCELNPDKLQEHIAVAEVSSIKGVSMDTGDIGKNNIISAGRPGEMDLENVIENRSSGEEEAIIEDKPAGLADYSNTEDVEQNAQSGTGESEEIKEATVTSNPAYSGDIDFSSICDFRIEVDLLKQKTFVFYKDTLLKEMVCSGGTSEKPTPLGEFVITRRGDYFWSDKYDMGAHYWVRFYNEYLFHSVPFDVNGEMIKEEYEKLGSPASHGCVRLALEDARWLYEMIPSGVKVLIY
jgi:lipoprotein-anchoring transpeptidase ErfK/SrfK